MAKRFAEICPFVRGRLVGTSDHMIQGNFFKTHQFAFSFLSSREEKVLRLRCGMVTGNVATFKEIGEMLGLTGERVRQIEVGALRKLNRPEIIDLLQNYTDETYDESKYKLPNRIKPRTLIRQVILDNISEETRNLSIYKLQIGIKAKAEHAILKRFDRGGINTCGDLIEYMEFHSDLSRFMCSENVYNIIFDSICRLIKGEYTLKDQNDPKDLCIHTTPMYREFVALLDSNCLDHCKELSIEDLRLSSRAYNALRREKDPRLRTVGDLIECYIRLGAFSKYIKNLGKGGEQELLKVLIDLGTETDNIQHFMRSVILNGENYE